MKITKLHKVILENILINIQWYVHSVNTNLINKSFFFFLMHLNRSCFTEQLLYTELYKCPNKLSFISLCIHFEMEKSCESFFFF